MHSRIVNIVFSCGCVFVIIGSFLKITHVPYGYLFSMAGFIAGGIGAVLYVANLKSRIKQLEQELASRK